MAGDSISREEMLAYERFRQSLPDSEDGRRTRANRASFVAGYRAAKFEDGQMAAYKRTHEFLQIKTVEQQAKIFELREELRAVKRTLQTIQRHIQKVFTTRADQFTNLLDNEGDVV